MKFTVGDVVFLKLRPEKKYVLKSIYRYRLFSGRRTGNVDTFSSMVSTIFDQQSYGTISYIDENMKEETAEVLMLHLDKPQT